MLIEKYKVLEKALDPYFASHEGYCDLEKAWMDEGSKFCECQEIRSIMYYLHLKLVRTNPNNHQSFPYRTKEEFEKNKKSLDYTPNPKLLL